MLSPSRKAAMFRAWRSLRWWMLLTLVFLWGDWLLPWMQMDKNGIITVFTQQLHVVAVGRPAYVVDWTLLWAVIFGVLTMGQQHHQGGLVSLFAGPMRRRDLYDMHVLLGVGTLWVGYALLTMYVLLVNQHLGGLVEPGKILSFMGRQVLNHTAAWAVGLAAGAIITPVPLASFCALGVAAFPLYLSGFVGLLWARWEQAPHPFAPGFGWVNALMSALQWFAPLTPLDVAHGTVLRLTILWLVLWSVFWYAMGRRWFDRLPLEHAGEVFPYPVLWHPFGLGLGMLAGTVTSILLTQATPPRQLFVTTLLIWLVTTLLVWQLTVRVTRRLERRRASGE